MQTPTQTLAANETWKLGSPGNTFCVLGASAGLPVVAVFYRNGYPVDRMDGATAGMWAKPLGGFDRVDITNGATPQDVWVMVAEGDGGYDPVTATITGEVEVKNDIGNPLPVSGSVAVTGLVPTRATGANTQVTVTNASAQMVAANAARSYLLIQNKDATGNIYVNFGAAATVANGVKIPPGGMYELNCNVLTAAVNAIGDIASNVNVVVVTG